MVDSDSSLELCLAMCDYQSFRLNYLVEKLAITEPAELVKSAVADFETFAQLV